ncbi:hypothetical protein LO762_21225 [Actinocorallia sp. API 0066]|uniref:hypothetical protein n=1 Tax=Actinocorallia sp. API 0066 TaxID=2896846 RepID=UPI001E3BFEF0|nr:hypothetical protein [Actinocorallia sp. API 0066]MCD0451698.1 hypothetical protein [Actinocorallia sp. API 0066]
MREHRDEQPAERPPPPDDEPDFAEEHTPGPSFPPIAPADGVGGQDEGYEPQTRV